MILLLAPLLALADEPAIYGMKGVDHGCAACQRLEASQVKIKASSTLAGKGYAVAGLLDDAVESAWCEGAPNPGVGEALRIELKQPMRLYAVGVRGGYFKSERLLADNARVKTLEVRTSAGANATLRLADPTVPLATDPSVPAEQAAIDPATWFERAATGEIPRVLLGEDPAALAPVEWVELRVTGVFTGARYEDLCISELELLVIEPDE